MWQGRLRPCCKAEAALPHRTPPIVCGARRYGSSTFTLKNLCAELVGDCHAASVSFSLPMTVYTRTSPLVFRLGDQVTNGAPFVNEITARMKIPRKRC